MHINGSSGPTSPLAGAVRDESQHAHQRKLYHNSNLGDQLNQPEIALLREFCNQPKKTVLCAHSQQVDNVLVPADSLHLLHLAE